MSYAAVLPQRVTAFEPSHVTHGGSWTLPRGAILTGTLARLLAIARPTAATLYTKPFGKPVALAIAEQMTIRPAACAMPLSAAEMTRGLKEAGLPVSGLADMMGVERKTVYAWLDGSDARNAKLGRLEKLHDLLCREQPGALKWFYRHWDRSLEGGSTLHDLLVADSINGARVRAALDVLRPGVTRSMESDRKRVAEGWTDDGPPGLMNLHLVAVVGR